MKQLLAALSLFISLSVRAQNAEEPMDISINSPGMRELIDKLWVDLPTNCSIVPETATIDMGEESCAALSMKHFRHIIALCTISEGFQEAIKTEFKIIKLIPVGRVAGLMLDVADLTVKALTANSPGELENDLAQFGFGRVVGEQVIGKLKELLPPDVTTDVLGNLTEQYYEALWDKAREAILPDQQSFECSHVEGSCTDNIHMSIIPYRGTDPKILGHLEFSVTTDCQCTLPCGTSPQPLLKTSTIHGQMDLVVDKAEVVEKGHLFWKKKVLEITLRAGRPSYHVMADCNCNGANNSNISYGQDVHHNNLFTGIGIFSEDAQERINMPGVNIAYTHQLSRKLGVTADAGSYFGKQFETKYRKLQFLAGPSLLTSAKNGKPEFMPHALLGIANTHSKYKNSATSFSTTAPALAIGTDIMMKVGKAKKAGIRIDFNPSFPKGGVVKSYRLSAGIKL